MSNKKLTKLFS